MNIALIAHDSKKELMVQFCIAYCRVFSQHTLVATGTTGKLVSEATGLRSGGLYRELVTRQQAMEAVTA